MRYVEPMKSFLLALLVILSLVLTFMIWNYKPNYPFTEKTQIENVMIGEKKQKHDIIKPYRVLSTQQAQLTGTTSAAAIAAVMKEFKHLKLSTLQLEQTNLSPATLNEMIRTKDRMTLFFPATVPLDIYREMLSFGENELFQAGFDRIIIDWPEWSVLRQANIYFISTKMNTVYRTSVEPNTLHAFKEVLTEQVENFSPYQEIERENMLSLYVTMTDMEAIHFTYYIEEISSELLKNVLFEEPNIVQKTVEGNQEKYTDSMSLLNLNTTTKNMNYVYPAAESSIAINAYTLLTDTIDYINEHGGFTADYRFSKMDVDNHSTQFQMYLQGYPVYSLDTLTKITTIWGDNRIFRYHRPYYMLDRGITAEKNISKLVAGTEVIEYINEYSELQLNNIDDIVIGYYLVQSDNSRLFILEPSWFVLSGNNWTRLTLDRVGGSANGLE